MKWMKQCYARLLIDNHITDLKPEFMSKFDPEEYVRMVKLAGVDSSMLYACDHNGNCYYPTHFGHQHTGLKGRDIFGETVRKLRRDGIVPIAYYTVIYHNHSAIDHPEWRQRDASGKDHDGRYHYSCPNHPDYVAFCKRQIAEIIDYDVDGIFIDMTFWPMVCRCDSCRKKYRAENGEDIPTTIDWSNPGWVKFQRARERWMADFAAGLTAFIKERKPGISVTHQFSPVLHGWAMGQSSGIAAVSDYASGDFYGNKYQQRLGTKIFAAYTSRRPYEFMTSRCVNLNDHTSTKAEDELLLHAGTTLANGGAFFFIDAINPDGTLNERVYRRLGRVINRLRPFTACMQKYDPVSAADCGLYFSMNSCVNEALSGTGLARLADAGGNMAVSCNAVVEEVTGTAAVLNKMHLPYQVVTDTVTDFSGLRTLIVNNAAYLSAAECGRIREFVRCGGTLIATGRTSFYDVDGNTTGNFQLAEVFGIAYSGRDADTMSYLFTDSKHDMVSSSHLVAPLVNATTAQMLGRVVLPDFPINDPDHYASIHSNPPGVPTDYAGLTVNRYGQGTCIYLYSSLLKHQQDSQQQFGMELLRRYAVSPVESANLPPGTEITLLRSTTAEIILCCLVNYQEELPVIPVPNIKISLRLPDGFSALKLQRISDGLPVTFSRQGDIITFTLEQLNDLEMIVISGE